MGTAATAGPGTPLTYTRLFADRRAGTDRRSEPRRRSVGVVPEERREVVDRRRGSERRSTLDRRCRPPTARQKEAPGEHVRNALQLLRYVDSEGDLGAGGRADLAAAIDRLHRALSLLERNPPRAGT